MASLNSHSVVGRIGKDPELKKVNDKALVNFSVATEEYSGKDSDGKAKYTTTWTNVTAWGQQAEYFAKNAKKGTLVAVTGPHTTNKSKDSDGNEREFHGITAREVAVLGGGKSDGNSDSSSSSDSSNSSSEQANTASTTKASSESTKSTKAESKNDDSAASELPF